MWFIPILVVSGIAALIYDNNNNLKQKKMANCNKLFLDYNENLNISKKKKDNLKNSKETLRERIRKHFKENHPDYKPEFYIQGSYKMKTTILTKDNECDLDDGVYFRRETDKTGKTLQNWVKDALDGATTTPVEHKAKCLRVYYKGDYHIDFPVYIFPNDKDHPFLAVKDSEFEESDPKEVVEWFKGEKSKTEQLNRIVKYLKGWGDHKRNKMPSGLAMTILASNNIQINDRDDIALKDTLIKIQETLDGNFECVVPATPGDDLFENYDKTRKKHFLDNLDDFIEDAKKAVDDEPNQMKASKLWRKHLGDKFPLGEDEDVDEKEKALKSLSLGILTGNAYTQKDGTISNNPSGIKHKEHHNYGG